MSDAVANPKPVPGTETDPLKKLDAAVIAERPTRHYRAALFQAQESVMGRRGIVVQHQHRLAQGFQGQRQRRLRAQDRKSVV